jgi:hypothetical protein
MEPVINTYVAAYYFHYAIGGKTEQIVIQASNEVEALLKVVAHWDQFRLSSRNGSPWLVYKDKPDKVVSARFSMIKVGMANNE